MNAQQLPQASDGWNVNSLHAHLTSIMHEMETRLEAADVAADVRNEQRFVAQQQAIKDALTSQKEAVAAALVQQEKAVLVAETNAEKWRASANEWRGAMNDREAKFATRDEMNAKFESQEARFKSLEKSTTLTEGNKAGMLSAQGIVTMIVGLVVSLIVIGGTVVGIAFAIKH